jgi:hypothetical protein
VFPECSRHHAGSRLGGAAGDSAQAEVDFGAGIRVQPQVPQLDRLPLPVLGQHPRGAGVQGQDSLAAGLGSGPQRAPAQLDDLLAHEQPPALQVQVQVSPTASPRRSPRSAIR